MAILDVAIIYPEEFCEEVLMDLLEFPSNYEKGDNVLLSNVHDAF